MAGMLSIGLTGLNAAQANLNTISHNISNASTPGYSRQTVSQTTNDPQFSGAGFFGQGVKVDNVKRQYNEFLNQQVLTASARKEQYAAYNAQVSQIDNLLADDSAGLSPALQAFFGAVNDVANDPSSVNARQALISQGETLAGRFNSINTRLNEIRDLTEGQISSTVSGINGYTEQIAALNERIGQVESSGTGVKPNDLYDQRDNLVSELNKLVKVSTFTGADGSLSVFMGSGQSLVVGTTASQLTVAYPDATDPTRGQVQLATSGSAVQLPESVFTGGALAGLLSFRSESLDATQDSLGQIAKAVSQSFNAVQAGGTDSAGNVHAGGTDLNGNAGTNFFADLSSASDRQAAGLFAMAISDPAKIAAAQGGTPAAPLVGDNSNALELAALQTTKLMNGGTATFQSSYAQLVSTVGNKAREMQIAEKAQTAQLEQATAAQQEVAGVNLDEEAANLIRYQQAYQAAARVMSMSQTLFESVLGIAAQ